MFDTGFSFQLERTADTGGQTIAFLGELAESLGITIHGARSTLGPDNRGRNCATIVGPEGTLLCEFEKIHPFTLGKELEHFTGGQEVKTYLWSAPRLTPSPPHLLTSSPPHLPPSVRHLLRPPLSRTLPHRPSEGRRNLRHRRQLARIPRSHRQALSIARAIENQAFVLSVNRCGKDPQLEYAGGTLAISPRGEILGQLGPEEAVLSIDIDMDDLHRWRRTFPAWKDHRLIGRTS